MPKHRSFRLLLAVSSFFLLQTERAALAFNWSGGAYRWPTEASGVAVVPVCFAGLDIGLESEAANWIRDEIEGSWGRWGNLRFVGWQSCGPYDTTGVVRVTINRNALIPPSWWSNSALGYRDSRATNMEINVAIPCRGSNFLGLSLSDETCTRAMALHEFGHALGFGHEQARRENWRADGTNPLCEKLDRGGSDDPSSSDYTEPETFGTPYDSNSVMNYCSENRTELSALDIIGLQAVYGRKTPGCMVGRGGRNLDVQWAIADDRTATWIWENNGTGAQTWSYDVVEGTFSALGKCLDGANGEQTFVIDCAVRSRTRWDFSEFDLRGFGARCLDRVDGGRSEGTPVQLSICRTGAGNQDWTYTREKEFRTGPGGTSAMCLDTRGVSERQQIRIGKCRGDDLQQFDLTSSGQIRARNSGLCLDVRGASMVEGTAIQLFPCKAPVTASATDGERFSLLNQQFNFAAGSHFGPAKGVCLDAQVTGLSDNGIATKINGCNGHQNQVWEYYFKEP